MSFELHKKKAFVCDLDGTLFMGPNPIAPAVKFVIDNTNINALERSRYIPAAKREGARVVGYFFESDLEACVARNAKRLGKARVPEHVIRQKLSRFERPILCEGFDALYRVKVTEKGFDVEELDAKE